MVGENGAGKITLFDYLTSEIGCKNMEIVNACVKFSYRAKTHNNIAVSISGGADSDVMLDLVIRVSKVEGIDLSKFHFIFFDTGIEYEATKRHLDYLEQKYGIKIERIKALKPVPLGTKEYGLPFLSKHVSNKISQLQKINFKWEDKSYKELTKEYPNCCKDALRWWCNDYKTNEGFSTTILNVNYNKWLKEFLIANPPSFKISDKCCNGAKKNNAKHYATQNRIDLQLTGIRVAEGGIRSIAYKTCFTEGDLCDYFRPIQWFADTDKKEYDELFGVEHSDCYSKYGFKRTGCAGCPFARDYQDVLEALKIYEPKLYNAVNNIFGQSYEYTRQYRQFAAEMKAREKVNENQIMFDM